MFRVVAAVLGGVSVLVASISCGPPKAPKYELKLPEQHAELPNGLKVILLPDPSTDLVEVDVRYAVGSNEDPEGKAGLAHLVEHMMFQQRPLGVDQPPIWEGLKNLSVFNNAYTTWDQTHYMTLARKENLESVLAIEATRLNLGCQTIPETEFLREREVVRNEIRTRSGTPDGRIPEVLVAAAYPGDHPYARMTGGDDDQLASITLEDVCKFMKDYYTPSRATLVIAGNATVEQVKGLTDKWFLGIEKREAAPRREVAPVKTGYKRVDVELDVEDAMVFVLWPGPAQYSEDDLAANYVLSSITGNAGFFTDEYEIAKEVGPLVLGGAHAPVMGLAIVLRDPGKVNAALDFTWKAAARADEGFEMGKQEEDQLRARMTGELVSGLESLGSRTGQFADYAQFFPEGGFFRGDFDRHRKFQVSRARSLAGRMLRKDRAVVVVVKPKKGAGTYRRASLEFSPKTHGADAVRKFEVDPSEAGRDLPLPEHVEPLAGARRFELGNGMKVILLPRPSAVPTMSMNLYFNVGAAHEPLAAAGLASVTADFLTHEWSYSPDDAVEATIRMQQVGARWGGSANDDYTVFQVKGLNVYSDVMLHGLERLIKMGSYNQESIERYQRGVTWRTKQESWKRDTLFQQAMYGAIFGNDHPYTTKGQPTPKSVGNLGRDAAFEFKSAHYSAQNATLVVVGDFDADQVEARVKSRFGGWDRGRKDERPPPSSAARGARYLGVPGDPNDTMISVRIAYPTPVHDESEAARMVMEAMLDEKMSAVREELGSSYGVGAGRIQNKSGGAIVVSGSVDRARAGESLAAMRAGVESLRSGADFDAVFVRARRQVLRNLLDASAETSVLASWLGRIATFDLPAEHYTDLIRKVATLRPADVKAMVAKELSLGTEIVVLMGVPSEVRAAYTGAGIQMVELVEELAGL